MWWQQAGAWDLVQFDCMSGTCCEMPAVVFVVAQVAGVVVEVAACSVGGRHRRFVPADGTAGIAVVVDNSLS